MPSNQSDMSVVWDRHSIKAEIERRGKTLTQLALDAGEPECTCRAALSRTYRKGERIIARFLGIPASHLWPARYHKAPTGRDTNALVRRESSQKNTSLSDVMVPA